MNFQLFPVRSPVLSAPLLSLLLGSATACITPLPPVTTLSGVVSDQNGVPLNGASVVDLASGNATATDADGSFSLPSTGSTMLVEASANGFAANRHQVSMPLSANVGSWVLHRISLEQNIILDGKTPTTLSFSTADGGGVKYTIPANGLVDSGGNVAQGAVTFALTYWDPATDADTGPGDLLTARAPSSSASAPAASEQSGLRELRQLNTTVAANQLDTFGEASLVASQSGSPLQVAEGINVVATFSFQNKSSFVSNCEPFPGDCGMWTLLPNSNDEWELLYSMDSPNVSIDLNAGTFTVNLTSLVPYLNIDVEKGNPACNANPPHMEGSPCETSLDCCQANGNHLTCSDYLCVPAAGLTSQ